VCCPPGWRDGPLITQTEYHALEGLLLAVKVGAGDADKEHFMAGWLARGSECSMNWDVPFSPVSW